MSIPAAWKSFSQAQILQAFEQKLYKYAPLFDRDILREALRGFRRSTIYQIYVECLYEKFCTLGKVLQICNLRREQEKSEQAEIEAKRYVQKIAQSCVEIPDEETYEDEEGEHTFSTKALAMMSEIVAHVPVAEAVEAEEVCHYPSSLAEIPNSPSLAEGVGGGSLRAPSVPLDSRAAHIVARSFYCNDVALENTA